ncbi:PAS domain S-box protein [Dolichospermum flos-aquae]|uniref:PAS domain S-box protein n=1 Tax=Dolichospermum flos-aquae LEGE 04289 TaxID=1828708 RepID=A0ACC5Q4P9_DOLFA|nr:PAS domain S-box protein [Dolichospermum flos-aquae]MBE9220020.1 PAS domain S-box protein [Dolichospermum flos-aquae LEGE 04289]
MDSLNNGFHKQFINLPSLGQIIDYSPLTISSDSCVMDAINLINQSPNYQVNNPLKTAKDYVLVVNQNELQGIFTIKDVLRVIALNINLLGVKIAEVMTQPLITLKASASEQILTAFTLLEQYCIQHLPIVDNAGKLIGIITEKNLLQALNIEKIVGRMQALRENFAESTTEHNPVNQQIEVIRGQLSNALQAWGEKQIPCHPKVNEELQETLEELQIAEEELRQQNEQLILAREITEAERLRYQNLFEFAPNGYFVTDSLGVIQEANQAASFLLSVPQKALIGKPLVVYIADKCPFDFVSRLEKLQNLQEWEMYLCPRQGSPFPGKVRVNPLYDHLNKSTRFLWSISDVSEQHAALHEREKLEAALRQNSDLLEIKVAERTAELIIANERLQQEIIERENIQQSLKESEERLSLAMAAGNTAIWDWHIQKNEVFWSPNMGLMCGLSGHALSPIDAEFLNLIYSEDREHFRHCVHKTFEKGVDLSCEYRVISSDSSLRWLGTRAKLHYDENGQPLRMIGTTRDITDRKETERKISEQAALLDIATDGILVRDLKSQIIFWNQGAERMYGWQSQEVLVRNTQDIFYKSNDNEQEIAALKTVFKSGSWEGELYKKTKSGEEIIVQSRWTLMLDADGHPKSILTVDTDITEKKRLQQQYFRAQRLESIGILAGGIAHDINNILTPILGSAQLLKARFYQDNNRVLQMLTIIENNAKQGAALVKQLLSFARGFEGKYTILQVNDLIKDTIQFAKQTVSKSIKFSTYLSPKLYPVYGDKTQLHQVVMNLVVNAADAMPNGGHLSISAQNLYIDEEIQQINCHAKGGNYIVITVTDTGIGMSPEILERIFEPFFTTKDFGKGTGLGLSTVQGIIKSHKGFINVDSKVGKGSKFQVFLPSINQEVSILKSDDHKMYQGRGELILLVDDEAQIIEVTKTILENYNYQIITARNGKEAIDIYTQNQDKIKLVLMDIMMPEMDGNAAICKLKEINPQVQIIACSGRNIEPDNEAQVAAILLKPYSNQELLEKLNFVFCL